MNELDRYAVSLENIEVLRAQVEEQAREIAALKAQPSGVVDAQRLLDWNRSQPEPRPIVVGREYQVADACARLNQPTSAGDERADQVLITAIERIQNKVHQYLKDRHLPVTAHIERICISALAAPCVKQARAALSANHSEQVRNMVPDFYWVEADEGSWNSPEEWAQDYYDYNGEKPESVSFSCAVELPPREYDSFEFDADGNCISCRLVNTEAAAPSAGSQGGDA